MPKSAPSPTPPSSATVLPFDSTVLFVLDDPISSKDSKAGSLVRVHLKNDLVVGGRVLARAGAPCEVRVVNTSRSDILDTYGFVDIFFEPLALPDGRLLPLRAPVSRLAPNVSSGHSSTVEAEDTVGDIVVPYYSLWQIFRKGKNFVLGVGSEIPARTEATLTAQANGTIAIVTPRPLAHGGQTPNSAFPVVPMATPIDSLEEPSRHRSTPSPSSSPSPATSPSSSAPATSPSP